MPVQWNLKQWLAIKHQIYRPSELQALLEERAGVQLSLQAISSLLNNVPSALRFSTIQALCNALNCSLSDFCQIVPDASTTKDISSDEAIPHHLYDQQAVEQASREEGIAFVKSNVDAAVRDVVLRVLQEQGLLSRQPNAIIARSSTIGVLLPGWIWSVIPDITRGVVEGITQHASSSNIAIYSISDENEQDDNDAVVDRFLTNPLNTGLIAVFPGRYSAKLRQLSGQGFPVVVIDDQEMHVVPWVGVDNATGAYMAVRHLIGLGHQRIAHIQGPTAYLVSHARYHGYCRALLEAGILPDPQLVLEGDFLPPSGRACAKQLFALPTEKRPTAIFAASDQMAYGVLAAAEEAGLSVPGDVALVGFDDDRPSAYTRPPLTTVRQPYFEMGQQSVALLLSLLNASSQTPLKTRSDLVHQQEGPLPAQGPVHIQLQANLVVRESCGANYRSTITPSSEPTVS